MAYVQVVSQLYGTPTYSETGAIDNFLFLYLSKEKSAPNSLLGIARLVMCLAEVPWFWFAGPILKRYTIFQVLQFTCGAYLVRFLWYATLQNPWHVLVVEPLHGITYAVNWSGRSSLRAFTGLLT